MTGEFHHRAGDAIASDTGSPVGSSNHRAGIHTEAEVEPFLPAGVAFPIEFFQSGDEINGGAGGLCRVIGSPLHRKRRAKDNTDAFTRTLVKIAPDIDEEIGSRAQVEIHQRHIIGWFERLHEIDMVVNRADQDRGLVQLSRKINGEFPIHQLAETLRTQALSKEPSQHGLARTHFGALEECYENETNQDCGNTWNRILVGAVKG